MTFRVEIAGGIAVGKTSLSNALKERGYPIITENLDENPFLPKTYPDKGSRGFDVGMAFMMSKAAGIETYNGKSPLVFVDYAMVVEYAYNDVHLKAVNADAHALVERGLDFRRAQIGDPDVLICLTAPTEYQLQNIKRRGRDFEQGHDAEYLQSINDGIFHHVHNKIGPSCRKVFFDASKMDVTAPQFVEHLIETVSKSMSQPFIPLASPRAPHVG